MQVSGTNVSTEGYFLNKVYIINLFKVYNRNLHFSASGNKNLKEVYKINLNSKKGVFIK